MFKKENITLLASNSFVDNPDNVIKDLKVRGIALYIVVNIYTTQELEEQLAWASLPFRYFLDSLYSTSRVPLGWRIHQETSFALNPYFPLGADSLVGWFSWWFAGFAVPPNLLIIAWSSVLWLQLCDYVEIAVPSPLGDECFMLNTLIAK